MEQTAKAPVERLSLEQLEQARTITEAILTQHMGASPEVDREIVERARIRLAVLDQAIEKRKNTLHLATD